MRTLALLLSLLCVPWHAAHGQETDPPEGTPIESATVSGVSLDDLSPGLRREIEALTGQPLNRNKLGELAERIEDERPDVVAAVRTISRSDGQARVVFLVARISDDGDLVENINARYTVESVEISGIPESDISRSLRDRLQNLVGGRLDHDEVEELNDLLEDERPGYEVERRISRGSERGRIRIVFEFIREQPPAWIPFTGPRSKFVYHTEQGFSGVLDIPMGNRNHRAIAGFAFGNRDDLLEEYSGVRLGFESRKLATEHLGVRIEVGWWNNEWRSETLAALAFDPAIPEAYRDRVTVEPIVTFAFNPNVRVFGGASISELESLSRSPASQMASAFVLGAGYQRRWDLKGNAHQRVDGTYEFRSATTALETDLVYKRHFGKARYRYERGKSAVIADVLGGGITGDAPLFERFTLGDTTTLRGWNKYEIAPAGGDRVFHQSLEYRYRNAIAFFLDSGSVWDRNTDMRMRFSTGFGIHGDNGFLTLAFPLNASDFDVMFMAGVRF
jgi:hypothetical protein